MSLQDDFVEKLIGALDGVGENYAEELQSFVDSGADINLITNGETPLVMATHSGIKEAIEFLLSKGAEVDLESDGGYTALHLATQFKDIAIMNLLIAHGAEVNVTGDDGDTPLHWIYRGLNVSCIDDSSPQEAINLLISKGINVNATNLAGKTILDLIIEDKVSTLDEIEDCGDIMHVENREESFEESSVVVAFLRGVDAKTSEELTSIIEYNDQSSSSSSSSKRARDESDDEFVEDVPMPKLSKSEFDFDDLNFMDFLPLNNDENTDPNANEDTELLGTE